MNRLLKKKITAFGIFLTVFLAVVLASANSFAIDFILVNALANRDIRTLHNNDIINVQQTGNLLNIRAEVEQRIAPYSVGFEINGTDFNTEKVAPYTLAGDDPETGDYYNWTPGAGSYTLVATAYNAAGGEVARSSISFRVVNSTSGDTGASGESAADSSAIDFFLVNSSRNEDIRTLSHNDIINVQHTGNLLNIRAEVQQGVTPYSVGFELNGADFNTERVAPYTLAGDDPKTGDYYDWSPSAGGYRLVATAYNESNRILARRTIQFQVTGSTTDAVTPGTTPSDTAPSDTTPPGTDSTSSRFNGSRDLISLHFDHCADPDDGHAAAADRSIIEAEGIPLARVHVVSGTYGIQPDRYQDDSEAVMDASWSRNGWLNADADWNRAVSETVTAWSRTLDAGGHIWIAEGGQSDFTTEVVQELQMEYSANITRTRIHLVQHGEWNERYTTAQDLSYVRSETDYIRISDGNYAGNGTAGLHLKYSSSRDEIDRFMQTAESHGTFGRMWTAAFGYLDPRVGYPRNDPIANYRKLDFSDSVELLYILGIGTNSVSDCATFANRFLGVP